MRDRMALFRDHAVRAVLDARSASFSRLFVVSLTLLLMSAGAAPAAADDEPPKPPRMPFDAAAAVAYRDAFAKHAGVPATVTNSLGDEFVLIPPGEFTMGPAGSTYRVKLLNGYYLAKTETTLGAYRRFRADHRVAGSEEEFNADDRPAADVSWLDARQFAEWLSERPDEWKAGRLYTLPTEAQWEWAARAGSTHDRHPSEGDETLDQRAWFNVTYTPNPKHESAGRGRRPVGKLEANAWGLHDVFGNVWEWCADHRMDLSAGEIRDPVVRGGGWRSGGSHCNAFAHDPGATDMKNDHTGFRLTFTIRELNPLIAK